LTYPTTKIVHMIDGLKHRHGGGDDLSPADLLASIKASRDLESAEAARRLTRSPARAVAMGGAGTAGPESRTDT
jgi:hypothetical protein